MFDIGNVDMRDKNMGACACRVKLSLNGQWVRGIAIQINGEIEKIVTVDGNVPENVYDFKLDQWKGCFIFTT